jgi:hypothetical protein
MTVVALALLMSAATMAYCIVVHLLARYLVRSCKLAHEKYNSTKIHFESGHFYHIFSLALSVMSRNVTHVCEPIFSTLVTKGIAKVTF